MTRFWQHPYGYGGTNLALAGGTIGYNGLRSYYGYGGSNSDQRVPSLKSGSYTRTRTSSKRSGFAPISKAFDQQTLYVKKRMPAKKRRRWVKFVKKVRAVNTKDKPKCSIVHTDVSSIASSANTQQCHFKMMYTGQGGVDPYADFMYIKEAISKTNTSADNKVTAGHLNSAVLECTVSNNGSVDVYIDAYYVKCHKSSTVLPDVLLDKGFNASAVGSGAISGSTASSVGTTTLGATPFQSIDFLQHFKILKKTRTFLQAGQSVQFEDRDPENHFHQFSEKTNDFVCHAGLTKGWLFIIYGTPKYNSGGSTMEKAQAIVSNQIPLARYVTYSVTPADQGAQRLAVDI